jgi:hypothetical protein
MTRHVEPVVLDLIGCEGFWTTERPRWSRSDTPSDGYLQVGRMCLFPAVIHSHEIVLTTCTNGRDITWDVALDRGYTLMPKPFTAPPPIPVRPPSWPAIIAHAWRSRRRHRGLLAAIRHERAETVEGTRLENQRRQAESQSAESLRREQCDRASDAFRMRHTAA